MTHEHVYQEKRDSHCQLDRVGAFRPDHDLHDVVYLPVRTVHGMDRACTSLFRKKSFV